MPRTSKKEKLSFPVRLHDMITFAEEQGLESSVIGWVLNGRGFLIHNSNKLMEILPRFFGKAKYKSFLRQLNMWNFERFSHGLNKGTYFHPYFVKDDRDLCELITRRNKMFEESTTTKTRLPCQTQQKIESPTINGSISPSNIMEKSLSPKSFSFCTSMLINNVLNEHINNDDIKEQDQTGLHQMTTLSFCKQALNMFPSALQGEELTSSCSDGIIGLTRYDDSSSLFSLSGCYEEEDSSTPMKVTSLFEDRFPKIMLDPADNQSSFAGKCFFLVDSTF